MSSASEAAGWTTVRERPSVVRATVAGASWSTMDAAALLADVAAGLTGRFTDVLPIDATVDRAVAHLLHAATGPDGEGVAIETRLAADGTAHCWVSPTARYAADADTARRVMVGRPVTDADAHTPTGVRVTEAYLSAPHADLVVTRRGPQAWIGPDVGLPASTLPAALWVGLGLGPRPAPAVRHLVVTSRADADRMLAAAPTDADAVRAALAAPDLPGDVAVALAAAGADRVAHWRLTWASGPADDERLAAAGRLEVLDGGAGGLWRVTDDLPADVADELGPDAVALAPLAAADVWLELTRLVAA